MIFDFSAPTVVGSVAVLTQGAPGLDFTDAGTGTCTTNGSSHSYSAGDACTVNVTFTPRFAGTRYGAVILYDTSGNEIASNYILGTGAGPQIAFSPAQQAVVMAGGMPESGEYFGAAVDGNGNIYLAYTYGLVLKETLSDGTYTPSLVGTGLVEALGVVVDGGGNVYISDNGNHRLLKETPSPHGYVQSTVGDPNQYAPIAIAVDGSGNLYYSEMGPVNGGQGYAMSVLKDTLSGGVYVESSVANGISAYNAQFLAVDGSGDVFIPNGNDLLKETPSGSGYTQSTVATRANAYGEVVVDGTGNLYVIGASGLLRETPSGNAYVESTLAAIGGVLATDGNGNLYLSGSPLVEMNFADPAGLSFPPMMDGQTGATQTVVVQNIGNQPLTFPIPSSGTNPNISANFTLDGSAANACPLIGPGAGSAGTLSVGASCDLPISFTPGSDTDLDINGSVVLTDNDLNAAAPGYTTQTISLIGAADPPFGAMAQPIDATTRATTVAQSDNVLFTGWAADPKMGAPVSQVSILIDGTAVGNATLGIGRPDIAADNQNFAYYNSGWTFTYPAASLWIGYHHATALVTDSAGLTTQLQARSFSVAGTASYGPPFGAMGPAIDATTRSTTVATGDNLLVTGWAADPHDGAPVSSVSILIDGATVGTATLGIARPDVVAAQKNAAYLNSGWSFTMAGSGLSTGTHTVSAAATDSLGMSSTLGKQTITVAASSPDGPPFGSLGRAVDSSTGQTTVSQSDNLLVEGWAADVHDGAPVSQVSILVDGTAAGNATLGIAQPGMAKILGSRYTNSGWKFALAASSLSAGTHTITAVATDSLGLSTQFQIREITVTP
ncbi:MAG: hypothetical protein WA294_01255 [Acidobacteriaceae bacterium]